MRRLRHGLALTLIIVTAAIGTAGAKIASRPAADWVKVVDDHERLAAMKIGEVVAALRLRPGDVVADLGAGSGLFNQRRRPSTLGPISPAAFERRHAA